MKNHRIIYLFKILLLGIFSWTSAMSQIDTVGDNKILPIFTSRLFIAGVEGIGTNLIINRYNAWISDLDWAKVTVDNWVNNIHTGFQTDGDAFATNFFGHPYHGSLSFNIARQQGASFWGSVPYVYVSSWMWEHLAETYPASEIDMNTTTLGGMYLGEMTHRLSAYLLRSDKSRRHSTLRNAAVFFINPMVQINGLMYPDIYNNIRDSDQRVFPVRSQFSMGLSRKFNSINEINESSTIQMNYSMVYGDFFDDDYHYDPFDFFILRMWVELSAFNSTGSSYFSIMSHAPLWKLHKANSGIFSVSSHYDFIHNQAFKIGALSLTADYHYSIKNDDLELLTSIKIGPTLFGSASSDVVEEIELFNEDDGEFLRDYVYGKGLILEFEMYLITTNYGKLVISFNNWTLFTQRDISGTEHSSIFKTEFYYPIWKDVGLGIEYFYYHNNAHYEELIDYQDIVEGYSEFKVSSFISF